MAIFGLQFGYLISPLVIGLLMVALVVVISNPKARRVARWRMPAFREASLAGIASTLALMLKSGVPLDNALALVAQLEVDTPAGAELVRWRQNLAAGRGKFSELAAGSRVFPPLFVWMAGHSGEDLAAGFQRVAETYQSRSFYRSELLLYSALPCAVLVLGAMIIIQIQPIITVFTSFLSSLADMS
jgi:type II secretory pathway component PulF